MVSDELAGMAASLVVWLTTLPAASSTEVTSVILRSWFRRLRTSVFTATELWASETSGVVT